MVSRGWVCPTEGDGNDYPLTPLGIAELQRLGVPLKADANPPDKRLLYGCVDWSERRDHFAGPLAVVPLDTFIQKDWLRRCADSRELSVTPAGKAGLIAGLFGRGS